MGRILLLGILLATGCVSIVRPWIGVVCAYMIVILTPQNIWWWNFEEVRPFYWVAIPTMVGFIVAFLRGDLNLGLLKTRINLCIALLWLTIVVSYYFAPYVHVQSPYRWFNPEMVFSNFNKIFLFYFLATVLISDERKLGALALVITVSTIYMIYWANDQFLSGRAWGRMRGPEGILGGGIYGDENAFAMLFVTGLPFIYYLGLYVKRKSARYLLWLIIPFGWHAVFLTGSRGGLVGVAVTLVVGSLRSGKKAVTLLAIPLFLVAYVWQAGDVMKERAGTISEYEEEASSRTRLEAWEAARGMILAHPLTGVGVASFGVAFPDFSNNHPRQAHNTFFQMAAEWGILAGIIYFFITIPVLVGLWNTGRKTRLDQAGSRPLAYYVNESVLVGLLGLTVCALFLSLESYEIFYYLLILANGVLGQLKRQEHEAAFILEPGK